MSGSEFPVASEPAAPAPGECRGNAGNNPAQQTALKCSKAEEKKNKTKPKLRLLAGCGETPMEHSQGHPVCQGRARSRAEGFECFSRRCFVPLLSVRYWKR